MALPNGDQYACYWRDSCNGQHELKDCEHWKNEFRQTGKYIFYYSSEGKIEHFDHTDGLINHRKYNPSGCARLHLLVYTIRPNGETHILFALAKGGKTKGVYTERPMLAFVYSNAFKRSQEFLPIAQRALGWISDRTDLLQDGRQSRFIFQHSNAVYPLYVTSENADDLERNFKPSDQYLSLHWFPLKTVLHKLSNWSNDPVNARIINALAHQQFIDPEGICLDKYELWSVTAACLMYIEKHVPDGYTKFLTE